MMDKQPRGTVVILSPIHWHFTWQTTHDIAKGFSKQGYDVVFVEPLPKRWPRLSEVNRVWGRLSGRTYLAGGGYQEPLEGMTLQSPRMLPDVGKIPQLVNKSIFMPQLRKKLAKDGVKRPLIMIHHVPISAAIALQNELQPDVSIYRCVYDWSNDPHSGRVLQEKELLQIVDEVWADCEANVNRTSKYHNNVQLMPPGVDLDLFADIEKSKPVERERPLCVYFGSIGLSVDVELLRQISFQYPLRLVGPAKQKLTGFSEDTEIIGAVPHKEVPAYIEDADILLLPYVHAPHMQGVIPAKLFECLITGKPIISIGLTSINAYKGLIYICQTRQEFIAAIEAAQNEPVSLSAARNVCAKKHGLQAKYMEIMSRIEFLLNEKKGKAEAALLK